MMTKKRSTSAEEVWLEIERTLSLQYDRRPSASGVRGKNWLLSVMTIYVVRKYLGVHLGRGAQPQVPGSGARLKKLSIKLATPNSPSTVK